MNRAGKARRHRLRFVLGHVVFNERRAFRETAKARTHRHGDALVRHRRVAGARGEHGHLMRSPKSATLIRRERGSARQRIAGTHKQLVRRQRSREVAHCHHARPDDAETGDIHRRHLRHSRVRSRVWCREDQHRVVPAEAKRVAHDVREPGSGKFTHRLQSNRRINLAEAGIGRELLTAERLDAEHSFDRSAGGEGMAEEPFRAGERRDMFAEQSLQRLRFRQIVVARAGAVGVHVIDGRRFESCPGQRRPHGRDSAGAFRMRSGDVMRIAARTPAAQPRENLRTATKRAVFRLDHEHRRAFTQTHAAARRIERTAALTIDEQQCVEAAPRHARERVSTARQHHVGFTRLNHLRRVRDSERTGGAGGGNGHRRTKQPEGAGDEIRRHAALLITRGARTELALLDQLDEKPFAIKRAADGTAKHDSRAVTEVSRFESGRLDGLARGEPAKTITAGGVTRSAELEEVELNFPDRIKPVARRGKKCERLETVTPRGDGIPHRLHPVTGRSDDAQAGDDGLPRHQAPACRASMKSASARTERNAGPPSSMPLMMMP